MLEKIGKILLVLLQLAVVGSAILFGSKTWKAYDEQVKSKDALIQLCKESSNNQTQSCDNIIRLKEEMIKISESQAKDWQLKYEKTKDNFDRIVKYIQSKPELAKDKELNKLIFEGIPTILKNQQE